MSSDTQDNFDADIAIIGGGIAGPALAAALADSGYRIVLIERSTRPLDTVRGDQLQPSTCEHLDRWGVLQMMIDQGAERRLGSRWQTAEGELIVENRINELPIPHPYFLYLNHELINEVLLKRANTNPNFTLIRPGRAQLKKNEIAPGQHGLSFEQDGTETTINARCIAIADGRTSTSRKILGIDADVYNYVNPLLIMFAERIEQDPKNDLQVFLTPQGIVSAVPRTDNHVKIGFPLAPKDLNDWSRASTEELSRRISQLVPALDGIKPEVSGVYPVAMVNAERWFDGNAVLLGDACHALHPGRSQGMNVAFSNVASLAEQLQAADFSDRKLSIEALLSSYEAKQKPSIDMRLHENHKRGLEMDNIEATSLEITQAALADLARDPEKLQQYCMHAAGY